MGWDEMVLCFCLLEMYEMEMLFLIVYLQLPDLRSSLKVLLAAAVCTRAGRAIVARQFVEVPRARAEGLLAAFPRLLGSGPGASTRQHTFVETDSVRYVYQPLEKLYVVLLTTKNSNILEDLETLRLFSRVVSLPAVLYSSPLLRW